MAALDGMSNALAANATAILMQICLSTVAVKEQMAVVQRVNQR